MIGGSVPDRPAHRSRRSRARNRSFGPPRGRRKSLEGPLGRQYDAADSRRPNPRPSARGHAAQACGAPTLIHTEGEGESMRKRRYAFGAILASAVFVLAACQGNNASSQGGGGTTGPSSSLKVGLVTDVGTLDDHNFNQYSWEGAKAGAA